MTTDTTNTTTPACPDPTLYAFTVYTADGRTKTGWRVVEEYQKQFQDDRFAEQHAQDAKRFLKTVYRPEIRVEYRKYWVLKRNYTTPRNQYWEAWNTPWCCSPSSELYWTM